MLSKLFHHKQSHSEQWQGHPAISVNKQRRTGGLPCQLCGWQRACALVLYISALSSRERSWRGFDFWSRLTGGKYWSGSMHCHPVKVAGMGSNPSQACTSSFKKKNSSKSPVVKTCQHVLPLWAGHWDRHAHQGPQIHFLTKYGHGMKFVPWICACMHASVNVSICLPVSLCVCSYVCIYICVVCLYVSRCVCLLQSGVHRCVYMHVCVCVCECAHARVC